MPESAAFTRRGHSGSPAQTELASGITTGATTMDLTDASTWAGVDDNGPFRITITDGTTEEETEATTVSGNTISGMTRGVGGTSAVAWPAGVTVKHTSSVRDLDEANYTVTQTVGKVDGANQFLVSSGANAFAKKSTAQVAALLAAANLSDFDVAGIAAGSILYWNGTDFVDLGIGSADEVLTVNAGATAPEWAAAGGSGTSGATLVRKTATESVTSSTVLQTDNELVAAVLASTVYKFRFVVRYGALTNTDIKVGVTGPAGASALWGALGPQAGVTDDTNTTVYMHHGQTIAESSILGADATNENWLVMEGVLTVAGTAGTFGLQWAQGTSNGVAVDVHPASTLEIQAFA